MVTYNYIRTQKQWGEGGAWQEKHGQEKGVGGNTGGCMGMCLQTNKCRDGVEQLHGMGNEE